jgi:hypothetical protein
LSVGLRKAPHKRPLLDKASINLVAADSTNGVRARINLREAARANSAGLESAGWVGNAAIGADLVAAEAFCAWLRIPAFANTSV